MENFASLPWLVSIFTSFLISLITIKLSIKILAKTKTIDTPNERSNHNIPKLKGAGIGLIATLIIIYYVFFPITDVVFTSSILFLCIISFINDNKQISITIRLLVQILLALIVVSYWSPLANLVLLENVIPNWLELIIIILFITNLSSV